MVHGVFEPGFDPDDETLDRLPISGIWAIRLLIPILNRTYRGRERSVARWRATNPTFLLMDIRLSFNTTMSRSELRPRCSALHRPVHRSERPSPSTATT